MTTPFRVVLTVGGATLAVLLTGYGTTAFVSWRRAQLAPVPSATTSPSPPGPPSPGTPAPRPAETPPPLLVASPPDSDQDGLPDNLEAIYRTNPLQSDTDGDGYLDGSEVANGYDPTIPSPDDKIVVPVPTPRGPTYTEQYFNRVGLPPSRENLLKSGELEEFVASVNARGFLPAIREEELTIVSRGGRQAVVAYLDTVSLPQNQQITAVSNEDIERAFRTLTEQKDPKAIDQLIAALSTNVEILRTAPVPQETLALHKQYLAATLALKQNAEALKDYQTDFVGVLVAASRIDNLRGVFRAVAEGIKALEKQYNIT